MNDKGVCRTAPVTPGLLKIAMHLFGWINSNEAEGAMKGKLSL